MKPRDRFPPWVMHAWQRGEHLGEVWDTQAVADWFGISEHEAYNILSRMRHQTYATADQGIRKLHDQEWEGSTFHQPQASGFCAYPASQVQARQSR